MVTENTGVGGCAVDDFDDYARLVPCSFDGKEMSGGYTGDGDTTFSFLLCPLLSILPLLETSEQNAVFFVDEKKTRPKDRRNALLPRRKKSQLVRGSKTTRASRSKKSESESHLNNVSCISKGDPDSKEPVLKPVLSFLHTLENPSRRSRRRRILPERQHPLQKDINSDDDDESMRVATVRARKKLELISSPHSNIRTVSKTSSGGKKTEKKERKTRRKPKRENMDDDDDDDQLQTEPRITAFMHSAPTEMTKTEEKEETVIPSLELIKPERAKSVGSIPVSLVRSSDSGSTVGILKTYKPKDAVSGSLPDREVEEKEEEEEEAEEEEEEADVRVEMARREDTEWIQGLEPTVRHLGPSSYHVVVANDMTKKMYPHHERMIASLGNWPLELLVVMLTRKITEVTHMLTARRNAIDPEKLEERGQYILSKVPDAIIDAHLPPLHRIIDAHARFYIRNNIYWCVRVQGQRCIYVTFISDQEAMQTRFLSEHWLVKTLRAIPTLSRLTEKIWSEFQKPIAGKLIAKKALPKPPTALHLAAIAAVEKEQREKARLRSLGRSPSSSDDRKSPLLQSSPSPTSAPSAPHMHALSLCSFPATPPSPPPYRPLSSPTRSGSSSSSLSRTRSSPLFAASLSQPSLSQSPSPPPLLLPPSSLILTRLQSSLSSHPPQRLISSTANGITFLKSPHSITRPIVLACD